jgi:hypothetical protein
LCPDPKNTLAHATAENIVFDVNQFPLYCRANKMDILPGAPSMLDRFRQEYAKHKEFLLAPVTKRQNGQLYFDLDWGIVKTEIHFTSEAVIAVELKEQGFDMVLIRNLLQGLGPDLPSSAEA